MTRLVAAILYVFLLAMQQEAVRHGFEHLRAELAQAHEQSAVLPADAVCDECALLAGASHALDQPLVATWWLTPAPYIAIAAPQAPALAAARPHYSARAPPSLT